MADLLDPQQIIRDDFYYFAQAAFINLYPGVPFEENWHIRCISEYLMAMESGDIKRLIILLPPRSLKSFLVARAFPAWVLGRNPHEKFIAASYGYEVSEQNSLACRRIMKSDWYKDLFPSVQFSPDLDRNTHYETTAGGQYYATSALSPITGLGATYLAMDDMLKPMEAMSDTIRNSTNQNIHTTFFSRFDDPRTGKLVMVAQRLHEDDPPGNLMRDGGYTVLKLPAETKEKIFIDLKTPNRKYSHTMEENSLLFPARLTRQILDRMRLDMTEIQFSGQMLQSPVPLGGGEFREEFIQYYYPESLKLAEMNIVILVDPSGGEDLNKKKKKLSDYTAMMVVGLASDNNYYLLDAIRDRLNPTERIETLFTLHKKYNQLSGKSPKVGYEKFSMQSDLHYIEVKKKEESYNFPVVQLGSNKIIKEERIRQLIPDMQKGRWWFPRSLIYMDNDGRRFDLVQELIKSEMLTFPKSRYDDMCFVCGTLIATKRGNIPIEKIKLNDRVFTPEGWKSVINCGMTGIKPIINNIGLSGTANHPIFTIDNGYIHLDTVNSINDIVSLSLCDLIKLTLLKAFYSTELFTKEWAGVKNTTFHGNLIIKNGKILKGFMLLFGNFIQNNQYQKIMKLIIRTGIHLIAILAIWSVYQKVCIENCLKNWICKKSGKIWLELGPLRLNGISRQLVGNGIKNMLLRLRKKSLFPEIIFASSVGLYSLQGSRVKLLNTVQINAGIRVEKEKDIEKNCMKLSVNIAERQKWHKANESDSAHVPAEIQAENGEKPVYNLTVEGSHSYFANGILVHNCDALSYVYDTELFMTFPMVKMSLKDKTIYDMMVQEEAQSWQDF